MLNNYAEITRKVTKSTLHNVLRARLKKRLLILPYLPTVHYSSGLQQIIAARPNSTSPTKTAGLVNDSVHYFIQTGPGCFPSLHHLFSLGEGAQE